MSKSLEALDELKDEIIPDYALEYEDDEGYKDWVIELYNTIKQDLERKEQLEIADRNNQNLVKTNVDLVNKNLDLQKENNELKDQLSQLKEESEDWQSAYEWSQAKNAILKLKNQELKEIIKANFFYHKNSEEIGYRKPMPKYQDKIKEVLEDE